MAHFAICRQQVAHLITTFQCIFCCCYIP